MNRTSVPDFESLLKKAERLYHAGDLFGADQALEEWITARRAEYERSKIDVNDGRASFQQLERVRIILERAEDAYRYFHDLVEIIKGETDAKRTQAETRH